MLMICLLWIEPFSHEREVKSSSYVYIPNENDILTFSATYENPKNSPQIVCIISFQPQNGFVKCKTFPQSSVQTIENYLAENDLTIKNTVIFDKNNLKSLLDFLGNFYIDVDRKFSVSEGNLSIEFEEGRQLLNSEQIIFYLENSENSSEFKNRFDLILKEILEKSLNLFTEENSLNFFLQFLDFCKSDFSQADYDKYHDGIEFLAQFSQNPIEIQ